MLSAGKKDTLGTTKPVVKVGASSISPKINAERKERRARSIVADIPAPVWDLLDNGVPNVTGFTGFYTRG